jgi:putative phage-type endonuclease
MPITAEQRSARRKGLGSSDIAAIMGFDPFRSAGDVWAEKVYDLDDLDPAKNKSIKRGNQFERSILEAAAEDNGFDLELDDQGVLSLVSAKDPLFRCNLDSRVMTTVDGQRRPLPEAVEAKWTAMGEEWGEAGTEEVPQRVILQAHQQMFVGELEVVRPAVLLARYSRPDVDVFLVSRREKLINIIVEQGHAWWEKHVLGRVPPENDPPSIDTIKRIRRVPNAVAEISAELVEEWDRLLAERLALEKDEKAAKEAMLAALGDAEAGDYGDPLKWVTYFETSTSTLDQKQLAREYPDAYNACRRSGSYRTPRLVKRR